MAAASLTRASASVVLAPWLVSCACIGYALPYGRRAFVARSASERRGLAQWLTATLLGLVAGLWAVRWFDYWAGSAVAAITAASLLLLISGGLLQIHEPDGTRHVRQRRLGVVFASLGLAIVVFPSSARQSGTADHAGPTASLHAGSLHGATAADGEAVGTR